MLFAFPAFLPVAFDGAEIVGVGHREHGNGATAFAGYLSGRGPPRDRARMVRIAVVAAVLLLAAFAVWHPAAKPAAAFRREPAAGAHIVPPGTTLHAAAAGRGRLRGRCGAAPGTLSVQPRCPCRRRGAASRRLTPRRRPARRKSGGACRKTAMRSRCRTPDERVRGANTRRASRARRPRQRAAAGALERGREHGQCANACNGPGHRRGDRAAHRRDARADGAIRIARSVARRCRYDARTTRPGEHRILRYDRTRRVTPGEANSDRCPSAVPLKETLPHLIRRALSRAA